MIQQMIDHLQSPCDQIDEHHKLMFIRNLMCGGELLGMIPLHQVSNQTQGNGCPSINDI